MCFLDRILSENRDGVLYDEDDCTLEMTVSIGGVEEDQAVQVQESLEEINVTGLTIHGIREDGQGDSLTLVGSGAMSPGLGGEE